MQINPVQLAAATLLFGFGSIPASANDRILSQLRQDDGRVGPRPVISTPTAEPVDTSTDSSSLQVQKISWSKPGWMQSRSHMPTLSARSAPSAEDAGYGNQQTSGFGIKAVLGWDSEYIFRGSQLAKQNAAGGLEASYGGAYGGVWAVVPTEDDFNSYQTRIDLYAGYGFDLGSSIYADVGVNGYIRADNGALFNQDDSIEAYLGASFDSPINPSIYGFYDFVLERYTFEASAEYVLPFGRTDLVAGGTVGYSGGAGIDYAYAQADGELVYNFNRNTSIGVGGHFAISSEPTFLEGLAVTGDTTSWFGVRLRAGQ